MRKWAISIGGMLAAISMWGSASAQSLVRQADDSCGNTGSGYYINRSVSFPSDTRYNRYVCVDFYVGAGQVGVVTIKRTSGSIDPDVLITPLFDSPVTRGETTGNELVLFGDVGRSGWYNVVIGDYSGSGGSINYAVHRIDLTELAGEALLQTLFSLAAEEFVCQLFTGQSCSNLSDSDRDNIGRGVGIIASTVQGRDLTEIGRAALIDELLRTVEGAGLPRELRSFFSSFISGFVDDVYRYY